MDRVALAFSGGLDTTVCVPILEEEYGYDEVIGVTVDVGQPAAEFDEARETANALDLEHHVVDATEAFAATCFDAVRANASYQGYPLGTALARPVIAREILEVARSEGCQALAHGCTGKGNDQLRFEAVWRAADLDVIAPVRDKGLTREWEIEYAAERDLPVEAGDAGTYSIDQNLWSRAIEGGDLEDPANEPPAEIYRWTAAPDGTVETVTIGFEAGDPIAIDGELVDPVPLIETLNDRAGANGVGRTDVMEDRLLGLKVRENYEHPAATTLLAAHRALEDLVLTRNERQFKEQVDRAWSEQAYAGLLDAPFVDALEGFIETTQERVTGRVSIRFEGGQARVVARESPFAAYSEEAASFDTADVHGIEQADATGVAKYHGFQERLAATVAARNAPAAAGTGAENGRSDGTINSESGNGTDHKP